MKQLNLKEGTKQLIIKLTSLRKKSKQNKLLQQRSILNTKRKTKPYCNTADNFKKEKNRWMKEDNKSKTALIKYPNFITVSKSLKLKDNIAKTNMNSLSQKEIFSVPN